MKEEKVKRYTLVIKTKDEIRECKDRDEVEELKNKIYKYNSKKENPFFCANYEERERDGIIEVRFARYKKLCTPQTLEDIDSRTILFPNSAPLREAYKIKRDNNNPIEIAVRHNKSINFLRVLYQTDKVYLSDQYLKLEFIAKCGNLEFVQSLREDEYLQNCGISKVRSINRKIEEIIRVLESKETPSKILLYSYNLFKEIISKKDGTYDYRLKRYLIDKIREINARMRHIEDQEISLEKQSKLTLNSKHKTTN